MENIQIDNSFDFMGIGSNGNEIWYTEGYDHDYEKSIDSLSEQEKKIIIERIKERIVEYNQVIEKLK